MPVFTAAQTKAALEPSNVVMPPAPPRPAPCWGCHINGLLVAHLGPRGVTRGLSRLNGLSLCHCLPISVHRLQDIDCITISHNVQQALKLICHTEFIGLCDGDKGRLVGSWTQKANTMYGFLNNTKAGDNSGCTNGRAVDRPEGPSPCSLQRWPGLLFKSFLAGSDSGSWAGSRTQSEDSFSREGFFWEPPTVFTQHSFEFCLGDENGFSGSRRSNLSR